MALGKIGAQRINNFDDTSEKTPQSIYCRLFYEPTRDALIRSHFWRFASARKILSQDSNDPVFEYDNQFILPVDFLRLRSFYDSNGSPTSTTYYSYSIEGDRLLTNDSTCYIRYTKRVEDASKFDPLFVEVLVLELALKLGGALGKATTGMQKNLHDELRILMPQVRALDREEQNTTGLANIGTWVQSRSAYRIKRI